MEIRLPALNLKAKLMALMVVLLGLTLGAELLVSLNTQTRIVEATQDNVKELASAIQISVQELTSVGTFDRDRLQNYVNSLHSTGLEVSIASSKDLIINSSNPALIGEAINRGAVRGVATRPPARGDPFSVPAFTVGPAGEQTVYLIPVEVEDHLLGYVQVVADFADFAQPAGGTSHPFVDGGASDFRDWAGLRVRAGRPLRRADSRGRRRRAEYRCAGPRTGPRSASARRDRAAHAQLQRDGRRSCAARASARPSSTGSSASPRSASSPARWRTRSRTR